MKTAIKQINKTKKGFPITGWMISLVLHGLLLAIPLGLAVKIKYKEVEMMILPEVPFRQEKPQPMKKTAPPPAPLPPSNPKPNDPPPPLIEPPAVADTAPISPVPVLSPPAPKNESVRGEVGPQAKVPPRQAEGPLESEFGSGEGPRFLHREMPEYPPLARRWGKEGKVVLRLTISEKGELLKLEVVSGQGFGLTEAAVQAVKKSTFQPARVQGQAIASRALLPILFVLRRE